MRGAPVPYPFTWAGRLCVLLALAKVALLVPILGRYGWDRDELYFLAAGRHLAFGYVDFPPLTAVAARLVDGTIGPSLISLRLLCSLLSAVAAVAAGAIARELGAGARLQVLAAAAWLVTPFGLGGAVLFHPTFLELAATALALLAAVRLVVRSEPRQWMLLGLWGGLGLEAKYTIVVPLAAFLAGCAIWRRDLLLRREAGLRRADRARAAAAERHLGDHARLDLARFRVLPARQDGVRRPAADVRRPAARVPRGGRGARGAGPGLVLAETAAATAGAGLGRCRASSS